MIITVAHQKGGVGKSTVVVNLAVEMQLPVIDLDSQHSCYLFSLIRKQDHGKTLAVFTPEDLDEIKRILAELEESDVIIDSGGYDNDLNRFALVASDVVITPVSPSQIEIFGLQKFATIVDRARKYNPELKVYVLINNADARSTTEIISLKKFIEGLDSFKLLKTQLFRRVDYRRAYQHGLSVCEYNAGSKACNEIKRLVREIKELNIK